MFVRTCTNRVWFFRPKHVADRLFLHISGLSESQGGTAPWISPVDTSGLSEQRATLKTFALKGGTPLSNGFAVT
jgi:hypothetical protein